MYDIECLKIIGMLFLYCTKQFPKTENNFLRCMHRKKKYICSMFSMFFVIHNKSVTDSNGCLVKNFILNFKSFEPILLLKSVCNVLIDLHTYSKSFLSIVETLSMSN